MSIRSCLGISLLFVGILASDCLASPLLVTIGTGPDIVLEGVTKGADGTTYLAGYQIDPATQTQTGLLVSIAPGSDTPVLTLLATPENGGSVYVNAVRGNYIVGQSVTAQGTQGLAWTINDPGTIIPVESLTLRGQSGTEVYGVNASGQYAGSTASTLVPMTGQVGGNTTALAIPAGASGTGLDVSETGLVVGERTDSSPSGIGAMVWAADGSVMSVLPNPFVYSGSIGQDAAAEAISPNGSLIGGAVGVFDDVSEQIQQAASVWTGVDWRDLTVLTDQAGNTLWGEVLGVTDNGYVVGRSSEGGFIWETGWAHAELFNNWAMNEFGISIPTWVTSVNDVFFDGSDLSFALQGSAYYFSAPLNGTIPEPAAFTLLLLSLVMLFARRSLSLRPITLPR